MKPPEFMTLCLAMIAAAAVAHAAPAGKIDKNSSEDLEFTRPTAGHLAHSSANMRQLAARETAGPDTFALYGGPDHPTEGKFQQVDGKTPDWGDGFGVDPDGATNTFGPGAWDPRDLSEEPVYWHVDTFNAENLNSNGVGNKAFWSGVPLNGSLTETWVHPQGYGNSWFDRALYESEPLADLVTGETVSLDFSFNHDLEPDWDFFVVQYDSAHIWTDVARVTGSNYDAGASSFPAPGVQFSSVQTHEIVFTGGDYGGDLGDRIRIRLLVDTDGGWSDQDGAFQSIAGAVQVDDISLTHQGGTFTEDYETIPGPGSRYLFDKDKAPFAGDFAEVYARVTDIDPCRENQTPAIGFLDTGQDVRNGPAADGVTWSTGGSTSPDVSYGVPGNWVVNPEGGLSFNQVGLRNEVWSPTIYWDLPGTDDDAADISGAFIRWTAWYHGPMENCMFYTWSVRSARAGEPWGNWWNRGFAYYTGEIPHWGNTRFDISDLLVPGLDRLQIALGIVDLSETCHSLGGSTPFPIYDNVAVHKYRVGGPSITAREIDFPQDAFPANGSIDASTAASRAALDVPFDMAQDISTGSALVRGDSLVIRSVVPMIPGSEVVDLRMIWALETSPVFNNLDGAPGTRVAPAGPLDEGVTAGAAGTVWTGEVVADTVKAFTGAIIADRYFFTLPDLDFMYPGDVLHWYVQAVDDGGRTSTLPVNTQGFLDFTTSTLFDRQYIVRALPSIFDAQGGQPEVLVCDDSDRRFGGQYEYNNSFRNLGYEEGTAYDVYYTNGPTSEVGNGLGSAAVATQLAGYSYLFYFAGDLDAGLLSDGTGTGANDKGDDIGLLTAWHAMAAPRSAAYFGDYIASALIQDSPTDGLAFVTDQLGVVLGDQDVRDVIGGQFVPEVVPYDAGTYAGSFSTHFFVDGGCPDINEFDQIQPAAGAEAGHLWVDRNTGIPYPPVPLDAANHGVASVVNPTGTGYAITLPYANYLIRSPMRTVGLSAKTRLIHEILSVFAIPGEIPYTAAPKSTRPELTVSPNPFNPITTVKFTEQIGAKGSVKVFNLRGELVRTLHTGQFLTETFEWDGTDDRGASVASGVYVIQAKSETTMLIRKVAMVR